MRDNALEITRILETYAQTATEQIEEIIDETAEEGLKRVKDKSPLRTGEYRKGWIKDKNGDDTVIRNKKRYQLTHLLEKGHAKAGGGRVDGIPHIEPVEEWIFKEIPKRIEEGLE